MKIKINKKELDRMLEIERQIIRAKEENNILDRIFEERISGEMLKTHPMFKCNQSSHPLRDTELVTKE